MQPNISVQTYLKEHILLFDGAMGTYFAQLFRSRGASCELANLSEPDSVLEIHRAYIRAGAMAIKTNTFGANRSLAADPEQLKDIITAGWRLANAAAAEAKTRPFVFADIGPLPAAAADQMAQYKEIVDIFLGLGAANFLFETMADDANLDDVCAYIKERRPEAFIITSFAVQPDGFTREGENGAALYAAMQQTAADAAVYVDVGGAVYEAIPNEGGFTAWIPLEADWTGARVYVTD